VLPTALFPSLGIRLDRYVIACVTPAQSLEWHRGVAGTSLAPRNFSPEFYVLALHLLPLWPVHVTIFAVLWLFCC
jgi:hypothetical protein